MGRTGRRTNVDSASRRPRSLTEALFSSTQTKVLGLLFGQPDRSFYASEIIGLAGAGSGAVQRELNKLAESGLVVVSWVGNRRHFQANAGSPVFEELSGLIRKTVGLTDPLRDALEPERESIALALVYGSVAQGRETAASDIDLLLISDDLTLEQVYRLLQPAEQVLARRVNPTLYTSDEFRRRRRERNPFLTRVLDGTTLVLFGEIPGE